MSKKFDELARQCLDQTKVIVRETEKLTELYDQLVAEELSSTKSRKEKR